MSDSSFLADLTKRLSEAEKRSAILEEQLEMTVEEKDYLEGLIEIEKRRQGMQNVVPISLQQAEDDLLDFIMTLTRLRDLNREEIAREAIPKGYFKPNTSPGRVLHLTLMNMVKAGHLKEVGDGRYRAVA